VTTRMRAPNTTGSSTISVETGGVDCNGVRRSERRRQAHARGTCGAAIVPSVELI
jgi:hypothetical protein